MIPNHDGYTSHTSQRCVATLLHRVRVKGTASLSCPSSFLRNSPVQVPAYHRLVASFVLWYLPREPLRTTWDKCLAGTLLDNVPVVPVGAESMESVAKPPIAQLLVGHNLKPFSHSWANEWRFHHLLACLSFWGYLISEHNLRSDSS